ncbi:MAG TPA: (2Fe-2S)-binding protein [Stellaceae bacterium]|nr:(2Fe-2S)-binding protein [Stellaceae bacterium]
MTQPERLPVALMVNGETQEVLIEAEATLLSVLREHLQLTGSKRGCNQGVCGACTVLIDGRAGRSCLALAATLAEAEITTIEGIRDDPVGARVIAALVEGAAVQCGFCTPGMVIALTELLRAKDRPDLAEIRDALSGNLCRCTGYQKIVAAALTLASNGHGE